MEAAETTSCRDAIDGEELSEAEAERTKQSKAAYMRARRNEKKNDEEWMKKQREHQRKYALKRKAKAVIGDVMMKADLVDRVWQVASTFHRRRIADALNDSDNFHIEERGTCRDHGEAFNFEIYNVSRGEYEDFLEVEPCNHCSSTCLVAGKCVADTCLCYRMRKICTHEFCCPATPFKHPSEYLEVKKQGVLGLGAFTCRALPPYFFLGEYLGTKLQPCEAYDILRKSSGPVFVMAIPKGQKNRRGKPSTLYVDGSTGGLVRYINHSCEPNVAFEMWEAHEGDAGGGGSSVRIAVYTTKPILPGEPLGVDYGWGRNLHVRRHPCACGAVTCRKFI
jgi:SET domain